MGNPLLVSKQHDLHALEVVSLEADVLTRLAKDRELVAYRHDRFWQSMDTLRDVRLLESLWQSGRAPWRNWE